MLRVATHKQRGEIRKNQIYAIAGVGRIHKHSKDSRQYRVDSIEELQVIIDHFDKYPLMTAKAPDYALFKKAFNLIKGGEHLNKKGFIGNNRDKGLSKFRFKP